MPKNYGIEYTPLVQSQNLSLQWTADDANLIQWLRNKNIPVVTVIYSGRPVILTEGGTQAPLPNSDAVIAAFLPGSRGGQALMNAIVGDYKFGSHQGSNKLTFPWPRNMDDISSHFQEGSLYPTGFGLEDWLVETVLFAEGNCHASLPTLVWQREEEEVCKMIREQYTLHTSFCGVVGNALVFGHVLLVHSLDSLISA